jgi:hypothetical protein
LVNFFHGATIHYHLFHHEVHLLKMEHNVKAHTGYVGREWWKVVHGATEEAMP